MNLHIIANTLIESTIFLWYKTHADVNFYKAPVSSIHHSVGDLQSLPTDAEMAELHRRLNDGNTTADYKCYLCGITFTSNLKTINAHIIKCKRKQKTANEFQCATCNVRFTSDLATVTAHQKKCIKKKRSEEDIVEPDLVYTTHPNVKVSAKFQAHLKHYQERQMDDKEEEADQLKEKSGEDGDDNLEEFKCPYCTKTVDKDFFTHLLFCEEKQDELIDFECYLCAKKLKSPRNVCEKHVVECLNAL